MDMDSWATLARLAREPWHRDESVQARPPRFDIAPRGGYWTLGSTWVEQPRRLADIYIFAWHPETRESIVDHREPEQWTFFVLRTETLPAAQRSISLARVERLARTVGAESLAPTVKPMLQRGDEFGPIHI